ncbi:putative Rab-like protein 3 [Hypsibius exemplaris]|uniref:Rab-like protein 3 n=1 Tax=Hypsibius exemplaris TaxID=2072580 RepID=A0A9X6RLY1_HYPEX|nr:putative Rab-like protein 3 [Hypsibius exemplaris]
MSIDSARVLVVGDVAAGKTSLIRLLARGQPVDDAPNPTVGCELEILLHKYEPEASRDTGNGLLPAPWDIRSTTGSRRSEPKDYFIEFLEIGATHSHAVTRRMFYHDYSGIILVYDLTSPRSCQRLSEWRQELQQYSFEHLDLTADGQIRVPEVVTGSGEDSRKAVPSRRIPILVVGTKADQTNAIKAEHRFWIDKILNETGAREIRLSTNRCTDLSLTSDNWEKLDSFYNKVVDNKFSALFPSVIAPSSPDTRPRSYSKYRHPVM